jgi:uncharacterized protein (DUF58 family)
VLPLALLIILGMAGLRGVVSQPHWNGPLRHDGLAAGLALEVVLGILLVITLRRRSASLAAQTVNEVAGKLRSVLIFMLGVRWRSSRHARRLLTLGLAGLFVATIARRPEFAGLAAPALLLLAAGSTDRSQRPSRIRVQLRLSAQRAFEGETVALDVAVEGHGGCSVRWTLQPGQEIELAGPAGATADGPRARFTFIPQRWGRRRIGTVNVVLRDRWRLAEGRVTMIAPRLDCYPAPAHQRTTVVLSRLPNRLGEHQARTSGEGIEFTGVREYVPGDRQRSTNWPASTGAGGCR